MRKFQCYECQHVWELPRGTGRPQECPKCASDNIRRAVEDRGCVGGGPGWGGGRGRCRKRGAGSGMRHSGGVVVQNRPGQAGEGESA